jgi:hypothetical protein
VARQYEDRVTIVGVPSSDTTENMAAFVDRHDLGELHHAVDLDRVVWAAFGVPGQPSWGFVSADGEVSRHIGPLFGDGLTARLDTLLE